MLKAEENGDNAACTRTRLHHLVTKGQNSAEFKRLPTYSHHSRCLSVAGFLLPAAKFIAFAHANSSLSLLPALFLGHHLNVLCVFKVIAPGPLFYQAA